MAIYSDSIGNTVQGVSINNNQQLFNFGNRIAELSPLESAFFVYLSKVAKMPTNSPVFKMLERRHQWQRRDFAVETLKAGTTVEAGMTITNLVLGCMYDGRGRKSTTYKAPLFLLPNQVIAVRGQVDGENRKITMRVTALGATTSTSQAVTCVVLAIDGDRDYHVTYADPLTVAFAKDGPGQVVGSAFAENTGAPAGWKDSLHDIEGYTQIFKTSIDDFSGTVMATEYRGIPNEFARVWGEKLKEHKMDIAHANLFSVGGYAAENGTDPRRFTWGFAPFVEQFGNVYNFSYANSNYDTFVDAMKDFYAPEAGNSRDKLVLASREVLAWANKLSSNSFLGNTVGASQYRMDVQNIQGSFGHEVTRIRTIFGNLHFVEEPLLRGLHADCALVVDLANVRYRPLQGNGISRDTFVTTNVQANDQDGRKDMITTEAGLEITLPETHAILKFGA